MQNIIKPDYKILLLLNIFIAVSQLAITIYLPALLIIAEQLHVPFNEVQNSLYVFLIAYGASQLFYGPLSDVYGRKKVLLAGLIVFMFGSVIIIKADSIYTLLLARFIQGMGAGAVSVLARAIIRDKFVGKNLKVASSILSMVSNFTPIVAPIIGGHLQTWFGWRSVFIFLLLYSIIAWLLVALLLPETNFKLAKKSHNFKKTVKNYLTLLTNKLFLWPVIGVIAMFSCQIFYLSASPIILQQNFQLTATYYANLLILPAFGYILGNLLNSFLVKTFKTEYIILAGIFFIGLGGCLLLQEKSSALIVALLISLMIFGVGIVLPNMIANAIEPFGEIAGTAAALLGFLQMTGVSALNALNNLYTFQTSRSLSIHIMECGTVCVLVVLITVLAHKNNSASTLAEKIKTKKTEKNLYFLRR